MVAPFTILSLRLLRASARSAASILLLTGLSLAADAPEKELTPDATGKVYTWQFEEGPRFEFFLPKDYESGDPINLTFILHGSNLDRRWGFANHQAGEFREADLVVSPDGTTPNGNGGFNSLQGEDDLKALHALHEAILERFPIRATYLYGHSQGSFFSFYYAGAYPDEVQGLVGQASGVWIGTQATKKHHHQAVVLMHGTHDPVVGYGSSVGGLKFYADAKYPMARLRSIEGWNHWPTQFHTEQQLAWVEGMTTEDPLRAQACYETLEEGVGESCDYVALYQVAGRLAELDGAATKVQKSAASTAEAVTELATKHVGAIEKGLGKKGKPNELTSKPWSGHAVYFLRDFHGVPACDALAKDWSKLLEKQQEALSKHRKDFWRYANQDKGADAFEEGLACLEKAFLTYGAGDSELLAKLESLHANAKSLELKKKQIKSYEAAREAFDEARKEGYKDFQKLNKKL